MKASAEPQFAFIFGVNWLWHCGVTASFGVFFLEIKCNGMTIFMKFMLYLMFLYTQSRNIHVFTVILQLYKTFFFLYVQQYYNIFWWTENSPYLMQTQWRFWAFCELSVSFPWVCILMLFAIFEILPISSPCSPSEEFELTASTQQAHMKPHG